MEDLVRDTRRRTVGLDTAVLRKNREDKSIRIRKDKRNEKTTLQRLKVMEDPEFLPKVFKPRPRKILEQLPAKSELLYMDDDASVLDAAQYFRKVLAIDKFPPTDMIIEAGVVPRLVELLSRQDNPKIQFECAWAITNITCGSTQHTKLVVSCGAIPLLLNIISCGPTNSREQALWALGNISGDSQDSRDYLISYGVVTPLLWQLGIGSPSHLDVECPSLTTMRHVAWTCANLLRSDPPLSAEYVRPMIYALAELLQSPDDDLAKEVCGGLLSIFTVKAENIQMALEQGILTRLVELCGCTSNLQSHPHPDPHTSTTICQPSNSTSTSSSTSTPPVGSRAIATRVLCAIGRSSENLHRKMFLLSKYGLLSYLLRELVTTDDETVIKDVLQTVNSLTEVEDGLIETLLDLDLLDGVSKVVKRGAFESSLKAGACLCNIVKYCGIQKLVLVKSEVLFLLSEMLVITDLNLLRDLLISIQRILFLSLRDQGSRLEISNLLIERVYLLLNHPSEEILEEALKADELLDPYK